MQSTLDSLLNTRANNFDKDTPSNLIPDPEQENLAGYYPLGVSRNFMYLTPELGERLSGENKVHAAWDEYNRVGKNT